MQTDRYYGLDALRGCMMLLGILLHAATFHLMETQALDIDPSIPILTVLGVIHQFRMPLFFLLAGYFASLLVQKYGVQGTLENRSRRLLIPFLLCLVTVVPVTDWLFFSTFLSARLHEFALIGPSTDLTAVRTSLQEAGMAHLTLFHLWFLYYLLIYVVLIPAFEKGATKLRALGWMPKLRELAANPWCALPLLALGTGLTLIPFKAAAVAVNDKLFVPDIWALLYYGYFFAAGYLLFHTKEILTTFREHAGTYGVLAFLSFVWYAIPAAMIGAGSVSVAVKVVAQLFAALSTWCFVFFLCGLFLNRFNDDTPRTRLLSQSAYWVYLLHMPVILFNGIVLMNLPVDIGPYLRLLINMAVTTWICFFTYKHFVRGTALGELLNGRRYDADGRPLSATVLTPQKI
ncbi:MAG: acyltransferase family protein [Pseudomonadota bacterium]